MTFHQRLILARKALGLSQAKLGEEIGVKQSTVATWETGNNEPDLSTIHRLAKALNRAPEWLAFNVGDVAWSDMVAVREMDVRALSGAGGLVEAHEGAEESVLHRYMFPKSQIRALFGVAAESVLMLEVIGDSMLGMLHPGEKVFVNTADTVPSPPGIFVLWDGLGLVLKRVEFIAQSEPPSVRISSDNVRYQTYERTLDEAYIQGRVIGSWQRR